MFSGPSRRLARAARGQADYSREPFYLDANNWLMPVPVAATDPTFSTTRTIAGLPDRRALLVFRDNRVISGLPHPCSGQNLPMSIHAARRRSRFKGVIMPKYMFLLGGADLDKRSGNAALAPKMFERYMAWVRSLRQNGRAVTSHKLQDQTGVRLTIRGGQVVEGPFMETKEAVGGVFVVEADSLEHASTLARECPVLDLQNGYVEVRVVEEVKPATQ